jgi:hypothetical protein
MLPECTNDFPYPIYVDGNPYPSDFQSDCNNNTWMCESTQGSCVLSQLPQNIYFIVRQNEGVSQTMYPETQERGGLKDAAVSNQINGEA